MIDEVQQHPEQHNPYHWGACATFLERRAQRVRAEAMRVKGRARTIGLRLSEKCMRRRRRLILREGAGFCTETRREIQQPLVGRPPVVSTPPVKAPRPPARPMPSQGASRAPRRTARTARTVRATAAATGDPEPEPPPQPDRVAAALGDLSTLAGAGCLGAEGGVRHA